MSLPKNISQQQLEEAVKNSLSVRQCLILLGVIPAGGNYATFQAKIKKYQIDTTHFLGKASNKGRKFSPKRQVDDYLTNRFPIQSHKLRLRLLKDGYFTHTCNRCKNTTWLNHPIPLELNHINGNPKDNTLNNLELLCPNCHALTVNYRGKNIKRPKI